MNISLITCFSSAALLELNDHKKGFRAITENIHKLYSHKNLTGYQLITSYSHFIYNSFYIFLFLFKQYLCANLQ